MTCNLFLLWTSEWRWVINMHKDYFKLFFFFFYLQQVPLNSIFRTGKNLHYMELTLSETDLFQNKFIISMGHFIHIRGVYTYTANVIHVKSTDNPCTDPSNICLANRSYMPKLSILFAGFVVWLITGKHLQILMTEVLQLLQTKSCRMYCNVDYAGI